MAVTTCFQRNLVRSGVYSPFNRLLTRHPRRNIANKQSTLKPPQRAIRIGDHINPYTGEIIPGRAYLPLSTLEGTNRAIAVFGATGSGKSVTLRDLVEYFAYEEGRCVIIFDDTKNQYWSFKYKQDRPKMLEKLKSLNIEPIIIPELVVYSPAFDEPVLGFDTMQRDFHVDKLLSIKTSALTTASFFELGNIDPSGRMYYNKLMEILNVPAKERTIDYINSQLESGRSDPTMKKSISSLMNIFNPLCNMGIIRDDGTDVTEMLHPPRKGKPGRISVINLGTSKATDCRKSAIVATICQQIFDYVRADRNLKPVIVLDEAKSYVGKKSSQATLDGFSLIHLQGRAWDITRIFGFQNQEDIAPWILENNTNYLIQMTKSMSLLDGGKDENGRLIQPTVISDSGLAHVFISGSGDSAIPDMDFYCKILPCRTKHID